MRLKIFVLIFIFFGSVLNAKEFPIGKVVKLKGAAFRIFNPIKIKVTKSKTYPKGFKLKYFSQGEY